MSSRISATRRIRFEGGRVIALVQRVTQARVTVAGEVVGEIDRGLLVLVCAEPQDGRDQVDKLVDKLLKLRIFNDDAGRMNRSVQDIAGGLLIVSQFTLAADTRSGNRPGFSGAAPPELARSLYDLMLATARARHEPVASGVFGADMQVALVNDGPVTIPMRVS
jgi:D-tyrosyl-tRNA(Tyr) deacylase